MSKLKTLLFSSIFMAVACKALAVGPDIQGYSLKMTPEQIKRKFSTENPKSEWLPPYASRMAIGDHLISYSDHSNEYLGKNKMSISRDLESRVISISFTQRVESDKSLEEILEPALKKYGKPFLIRGQTFPNAEDYLMKWGADKNNKKFLDADTAASTCRPYDRDAMPNCAWTLDISARREKGSGWVEIRSMLSNPRLDYEAFKRAKENGAKGKARF